jgi:formamidase
MAIEDRTATGAARRTLLVDTFTDGLLGPDVLMLGPVRDGGHIVWNPAPGCWGPMITPSIRGGHEVCRPVAVEGAEVGDAIAIRIKDIAVTSRATSSGNDQAMEGRFNGDPYCAAVCPGCGTEWPETRLDGIGPTAVRCAKCGADCAPFTFTNGYTLAFDEPGRLGLTLPAARAEEMARHAAQAAALPDRSVQNPILTFAPHDIVGLVTRMRPFLGQIGTSPSATIPDSHNAGDFGAFLVGAPHRYAMDAQELQRHKTDGHLDIDAARAGAVLVCPVKVPGGGVYVGDMHAMQGDGEIAGHTADVAGTVTLQVEVIKGLGIDGPLLFPVAEDLPFLARPLSAHERDQARALARRHGMRGIEEALPISVIGTGPDLNSATDNGLARAAELLETTVPEVANRATISGAIEIGRHPGVVQVTFRAPVERLEARGLLVYAVEQYGRVPGSEEGAAGAGADARGITAAVPGTEGSAPSGA